MAGAFLWDDKIAAAVALTAPVVAAVSSLPLSNLIDPQPRIRARLPADTVAVLADLGTATAIECVALISTTLDNSATIRLRLGPDSAFASPDYDSGTISAATAAAANGNVVLLLAAAISSRYLRVDLVQSGAAQIDLGRLVAGPVWRPTRSHAYGITEGRVMLDRRDRNLYTGAEFATPAVVNPRSARFTLPLISTAEVIGQHRSMLAALGAAGEALWIPDTALSLAEMNNRSLWAAIATPGDATAPSRDSHPFSSRYFTLTERV